MLRASPPLELGELLFENLQLQLVRREAVDDVHLQAAQVALQLVPRHGHVVVDEVEPAAGVNASITDLGKWLIANMGHQPDVLSAKLLNELTIPRIKTKKDLRRKYWGKHLTDAHYGYGWRIYQFNGQPFIYHSGWVSGFVAEVGYSPHLDMGFALLLNAESGAINKISSQFWTQAHQLTATSSKSSL